MARDLTASVLAALAAGTIRPFLLVEMEFSSGFLRVWSGLGTLTWNSLSWTGTGDLLGVTPAVETTDVRAHGVTVRLGGVKSSYLALALGAVQYGKPLRCWWGFLDASEAVIADPALIFDGRVDRADVALGGASSTVTVYGESRLIGLRHANGRRYTPEDQMQDYPADLGFAFVPYLQKWQGNWGGGPSLPRSVYSPAPGGRFRFNLPETGNR